jgi:hypothetical protein
MLVFVSGDLHCNDETRASEHVSHHSESNECADSNCALACCHMVLGQVPKIISESRPISLIFKTIIQHPSGKSNKIITPLFRPPISLS